jgi:hypothetical protein
MPRIPPKLRARVLPAQRGETGIAAEVLNHMTRVAKPASMRTPIDTKNRAAPVLLADPHLCNNAAKGYIRLIAGYDSNVGSKPREGATG